MELYFEKYEKFARFKHHIRVVEVFFVNNGP